MFKGLGERPFVCRLCKFQLTPNKVQYLQCRRCEAPINKKSRWEIQSVELYKHLITILNNGFARLEPIVQHTNVCGVNS